MHKERLQQMVTMLRALPEEHPKGQVGFHLNDWLNRDSDCGTTACAVGHACLNPVFKEQGLYMERGVIMERPRFKEFASWDAVMEFFEITSREANYLFSVDEYIPEDESSPVAVADRIEQFIAEQS